MKTIPTIITIIILAVIGIVIGIAVSVPPAQAPVVVGDTSSEDIAVPKTNENGLQITRFTGELTELDQGCIIDAPCSVTVDGKVVQTSPGFVTREYSESLGIMDGAGDISDLNALIDTDALVSLSSRQYVYRVAEPITVEVYARVHEDGLISMYGSEEFYIRVVE